MSGFEEHWGFSENLRVDERAVWNMAKHIIFKFEPDFIV